MKRLLCRLFVLVLGILGTSAIGRADEGMFPITEIQSLDLKSKGLKITVQDIYNPGGISLIDGICNLGGCTGSFVSPQGLILTNHHCAFGAIQAASTPEHNILRDGFLARNRAEEIQARGYTVRITESARDVSSEVLSVLTRLMTPSERTKAVENRIKQIVAEAEKSHPQKRAQVSEMFPGKSYVLFISTYLKDIRLVYAPPLGVGNFGGEEDNWMWPRHTGDFSIMRAYSAPDGSPADFSPDNIPYRPRKVIPIAAKGIQEGDFVFVLGYPGRTYRHQTSHYLDYEETVRMPFVRDLYGWQISEMEKMAQNDPAVALKLSSRIKGLANTYKNTKGKLEGTKRLGLLNRKREEERAIQQFIDSDPDRRTRYGTLLASIGSVYREMVERADRELLLGQLLRVSTPLQTAYNLVEAAAEREKPDMERESPYMDRNFAQTKQNIRLSWTNFYMTSDRLFLENIMLKLARLSGENSVPAILKLVENRDPVHAIAEQLERAYAESRLPDPAVLDMALSDIRAFVDSTSDPFVALAKDLRPTYLQQQETGRTRRGVLDTLYAHFMDVKQAFLGRQFIPDANGTLRLTYGTVRGYSPKDGVVYRPFTTVEGILQKTTGTDPFDTPARLIDLVRARDFGRYESKKLKSVPVAMLYDMDTTGGNSGSPVLNARGEIVGINFDRTFEATINDFMWSKDLSRSIAVDIRYVLWVTDKLGGGDYLLKEMKAGD